jgi:hypothetical protein
MSVRWLVICAALLAIGLWIYAAKKRRINWLEAVPPVMWMLHLIVFYLGAACHILPSIWLNAWSGAVYLHGIIMLAFYVANKDDC